MTPEAPRGGRAQALSFLLGGVVPLIAFTVIEEKYGTYWGLIAGLVFGAGEIAWELFRYRRVSKITWFGNGLLFIMGAISLMTNEGVWFKLQPAIIEAAFANRDRELALLSKHLCPSLLLQELQQLQSTPEVLVTHAKPGQLQEIASEIAAGTGMHRPRMLATGTVLDF